MASFVFFFFNIIECLWLLSRDSPLGFSKTTLNSLSSFCIWTGISPVGLGFIFMPQVCNINPLTSFFNSSIKLDPQSMSNSHTLRLLSLTINLLSWNFMASFEKSHRALTTKHLTSYHIFIPILLKLVSRIKTLKSWTWTLNNHLRS